MSDQSNPVIKHSPTKPAIPLAERLDPAINEASTGIGAYLTDLVRRTLRGGVQRVDEEMQGYVEERVDATVADRMPAIEEAVTKTAESTARVVATDKVDDFEKETKATFEGFERETKAAFEGVERETKATAERLANEISEAERRVQASAVATVQERIEDLTERSKLTATTLREQIHALQEAATAVEVRLDQEQQAREALGNSLSQSVAGELEGLKKKVSELMKSQSVRLDKQLRELQQANEALATRIAELEKPRGLRALFSKLSSKKEAPG